MLSRNSIRAVVAAMAILVSAAFNHNVLWATWVPGDLITYPQGMWSDDPTAAGLLFNNFVSVYSSSLGIVEAGIPGGFSIQFSDAGYVMDYLPSGGTLGPLNANLFNPTSTSSGRFGGEVLALRLNIDFSDAGLLPGALGIPFGDLELHSHSALPLLNGLTVRQVSAEVNTLLGGGSGIYSIAQLGGVTAELNSSFGAGGVSDFAEDHLRVVPGIPGDYNANGTVDAADYVVWRKGLGTTYTSQQYNIWRTHFGELAGGGAAQAIVPEPAAAGLALVGLLVLACRRKRRCETGCDGGRMIICSKIVWAWRCATACRTNLRRGVHATALALIGLVLALASAAVCQAQFGFLYEWDGPAGGAYASNANWTPSGIPDNNTEGARFNVNANYSVQLPASNVTVNSLAVAQGDVELAFVPPPSAVDPPYTYTTNSLSVNSTAGASPALNLRRGRTIVNGNLTVASNGQANLNLLDAGLITNAAAFGVGTGSVGDLAINDRGDWTGFGTPIIGAAGTGRLEIMASFRAVQVIGHPAIYFPTQGTATTFAAVLGKNAGSSGVATVHGLWNTGDLTVGDAGTAEVSVLANQFSVPTGVNVSSAGTLDSGTVSIAAQPGSSGTVNVTGFAFHFLSGIMASQWNIAGSLALGGTSVSAGGSGQLVVGERNTVSVASNMAMWSGGKLSIHEFADLNVAGKARLNGTLEFVPSAPFNPQLNEEFEILTAASGVSGTFISTILPTLDSGLAWTIHYDPTSVSLSVVQAPPGDYNANGIVDAADYVVYRNTLGQSGIGLAADGNGNNQIDAGDYDVWRAHFGQTVGSGSALGVTGSAAALVPEPASVSLAAAAALLAATMARRRASRNAASHTLLQRD